MRERNLTIERRQQIIRWINSQDIFRMKQLFHDNQVTDKEKGIIYQLIKVLRIDEYLTGLERDQYVRNLTIPITMKSTGTY